MNRISFCHDIRDSFSFVRKENESLSLSLSRFPKRDRISRFFFEFAKHGNVDFRVFSSATQRIEYRHLLSFENIFRSMIAPRDRNDNEKRIRSILLP